MSHSSAVSYVLAFLGFAALIVLHEAGHFAAAKAVKMRVERFSLFFGPLVVRRKVGETEYGIGIIPLGGYVKITGMSPNEANAERDELERASTDLDVTRIELRAAAARGDRDRSVRLGARELQLASLVEERQATLDGVTARGYINQPVWKRIVVILAGPAVNFLVAFLLVGVYFLSVGHYVHRPGIGQTVQTVQAGSPAARALRAGDEILRVDGRPARERTLTRTIDSDRCAGAETNGCVGTRQVDLTVLRNGRTETIAVRPRYSAEYRRPLIGFDYVVGRYIQSPTDVPRAAGDGARALWHATTETLSAFAHIFQTKDRKQLHSVVGAYKLTQKSIATSGTDAIQILALISLSLGVINLFPFLPLDGGHVFWALAEKVRGRRIPFSVMERASFVGIALVLMIFAIGLSNDISTIAGKGFQAP